MISMASLLKFRVVFITLLFGIFGSALTLLLQIDEMESYYRSLAPLLALVISLFISFMIKMKWNIKTRNKLKIIVSVILLMLLISIFFYTRLFLKATFPFRDINDKVAYYVKGNKDSYTQVALDFKAKNPSITSDAELIRNGFEGPHNKRFAWTEESISNNILNLIAGYCIVIILFTGIISLLSEILVLKYPKSTKKTSE
jgi:amino acid transporter